MSRRDSRLLVNDILVAAQRILEYTHGMGFDDFKADQKTIDAVVRNFEIIGEAANQISIEFQNSHDSISWRDLSDFRNRLIHEYFGVDLDIVWEIIINDLEDLVLNLKVRD